MNLKAMDKRKTYKGIADCPPRSDEGSSTSSHCVREIKKLREDSQRNSHNLNKEVNNCFLCLKDVHQQIASDVTSFRQEFDVVKCRIRQAIRS